jgi:cytosine/adenosine deaminase-related metal-dependent hydrolase
MDPAAPILKDAAVVFDKTVLDVTDDQEAIASYKARSDMTVIDQGAHSVVMPGLINSHLHLEFSAHRTELNYGSFMGWLYSVMEKREALVSGCKEACYARTLEQIAASGVTTIGAVSSYGFDLKACAASPLKVVYFSELIGSNPAAADMIFADFVDRLESSFEKMDERLFPAVAIHSPYSVHPVLVRKAVHLAKSRGLPVSAHFMESRSERRWLDSGSGEFRPFFEQFLKTATPVGSASDFLSCFEGVKPLFIHGVHASDEELSDIAKMEGTLVHCPVSNRLLGCGRLNLEKVKNREIGYAVATDGLSSNYSLSLFGELRNALLMHEGLDLGLLARDLIRSVTEVPARALGLHTGRLVAGRSADIIGFNLPGPIEDDRLAYAQVILHAGAMGVVFVDGEPVETGGADG